MKTVKNYLLLIWENTLTENTNVKMVFTSDDESKLQHLLDNKGQLADEIENALDIKIDVDDFDSEMLSLDEFYLIYGHSSNPNQIILSYLDIVNI